MIFGTIKWFSRKKGFGFIELDDGTEVFLHILRMLGDVSFPTSIKGRRIIFKTEPGIKGLRAVNAQLLLT